MPDAVTLSINGQSLRVPVGSTVAAAVLISGETTFRHSVTGESRAPLCGMGICYECRVTVNGQMHARSCQIVCAEGMEVRTDA
jgi:D-hydroxyproline dehydrogenase subunit gamma